MGQELRRSSLYHEDFYSWTHQQAELLRAGRFQDADLANIVEEIETLGRSEASALRSSLRLIAQHLLKLLYQPEKAAKSWRATIVRERIDAERTLLENPGLKSRLQELFAEAYADARRVAAAETGLPVDRFPTAPVFDLDQVRNDSYMPGRIKPD